MVVKKILLIAAAVFSIGVGSAFAGDGDVNAQPAQTNNAMTLQQGVQAHRLFPATTRSQVNVYSSFGDAGGDSGTVQGGSN
jgi:hypothetical protein